MLCIGDKELVKGGNEGALNGRFDFGLPLATGGLCLDVLNLQPSALSRCMRPLRPDSRIGWLLRRPLGWVRLGQFCVVSGVSPIWLSVHLCQQMREDGKFKNLANKAASFLFFPSGNLCQYQRRNEMHNVEFSGSGKRSLHESAGT